MRRLLPNAVTIVRLLLVPVFVAWMLGGRGGAAALTLAAIGVSDWLDGWLARRWRVVSRWGALLDPVADKLTQLVAVALLASRRVPGVTPVPFALLALLVARELVLVYGAVRIRLRRRRVRIRPRWEGKASTFLVFALALAACVGAPAPAVALLSLLAAPFIAISGVRYVLDGRRQYRAGSAARARAPRRAARGATPLRPPSTPRP
ncbi:MAG: CDP-alcohol phosphatidyltransferase family protein [Planctomycetota bacterium]